MTIIAIFKLIFGVAFLLAGLFVFLFEIYGVFHLNYVFNRMHSAAMGDTLGLLLSLVGLMFLSGISFTTLKLALVILFFWLSSPVSSHLLAKLVMRTDDPIDKKLFFRGELKDLEKKLEKEKEANK